MSRKHRGQFQGDPVTYQTPLPAGGVKLETFIPWTLIKRGIKKQIITPIDAPQEFLEEAAREKQARADSQDSALMRALGLAYHWQRLLETGSYNSMTEIATAEGMDLGQVSRIAQLVQLAPDLVEGISQGKIKASASQLVRNKLPASWQAQHELLHADRG